MKKIYVLFTLSFLFIWNAKAQFPEGFETSVPPAGWVSFEGTNGLGTVESWQTTADAATGAAAAFISHEDESGTATEDWLVTPQFTPVDGDNLLAFYQKQFDQDFDYGNSFEIRVSTNTQNTHADFVTIDTWYELDFNSVYSPRYLDLSAYNGTPIYVAFVMTQDDGEDWYIDDVDVIANANAPECGITSLSLVDAAIDVDINLGTVNATWSAPASGDAPTGYNIYLGTTSGSLNLFETVTSGAVNLTELEYNTTYYWQVIPFNVGGEASSCTELSFTTEAVPSGSICTDAIVVLSLPYNHSENTGNFGNDYSSTPGASCGTNNSYLSGNDVVYAYTAVSDGAIDLRLTNLGSTYVGMFVYEDCADIGVTCAMGSSNENTTDDVLISGLNVTNGNTYYIVISTWADPMTTSYTLDIFNGAVSGMSSCSGVEGSITVVTDCLNSGGFFIDVEATSMGTLSSIELTDDQGSPAQVLNGIGVLRFGPYVNMTQVVMSLSGDGGACLYTHTALTQETCPLDPDYLNDFSIFPGTDWSTGTGSSGSPDPSTSGWEIDDFANDNVHANGKSAKVSIYGSTRNEYIISPEFNLLGSTFYMNFDIALTDFVNTTNPGTLGVDDYVALFVTEDDWTTNVELVRWDSGSIISNTGEAISEIELTGYGATTKFGLYAFSDISNSDNEFFFDNFRITNNSLSVADIVIEGFEIYPNPARGSINLRARDIISQVGVYNLLGQEVKRSYPNEIQTQIIIDELSIGVYIIKVQVGKTIGSYKVVKQ